NKYLGVKRYWDYNFDNSITTTKSEEDYLYELRSLFERAVTRQLVSDVPIGSYLSGGIDSGSITSIASRSINRLLTFTCGFDMTSVTGFEASFDERVPAEMMSNVFKTEHYEMVIHAGDMPYIMPKLIYHLEDLRLGMCYQNHFISRLASKFVKVVLSGAGGDELFAGYPWRYYIGLGSESEDEYYRRYYNYWQRLINDEKKKDFFSSRVINELQEHSTFDIFKSVFLKSKDISKYNIDSALNNSLYFEAKTFLNGLFIIEDKLSMANSLESRVPFMDDEIVEFSMRLPVNFKLGNYSKLKRVDENILGRKEIFFETNDGKTLLRKAMEGYIPKQILERKKQGFSAPDESWYKGESLSYVREILLDKNTLNRGYFKPKFIEQVLNEHCQGKKNHRLFIWSLLCFEWWNRIFIDNSMADYL
ncbi:MAG: asparagine synthetase B family protein, partial [Deltaproteobacteria bacterium]